MSAATIARRPLTYIAAGGLALLCYLLVVWTGPSMPATTTVSGTYNLDAGYAAGCTGTGDYTDIYDGTPVWVLDEAGHPLAHSALQYSDSDRSGCRFTFNVVSDSAPFWVQVGSQEKVRVSDSPMELRAGPPRQP